LDALRNLDASWPNSYLDDWSNANRHAYTEANLDAIWNLDAASDQYRNGNSHPYSVGMFLSPGLPG
jgi:hypothetical protein